MYFIADELPDMVARVYKLIIADMEQRTGHRCCIAGGAIRDALLGKDPKDIDLFVLGPGPEFDMLSMLDGLDVQEHPELDKYENSSLKAVFDSQYTAAPVQVCWHPEMETPQELLKTFDWNICLFVYDGFKVYRGDSIAYKRNVNSLELNDFHEPYIATLRRGFRFQERYGINMPIDTLEKLLAASTNEIRRIIANGRLQGVIDLL